MKQKIDLYEFREQFKRIRPENFSYEGLEVLFNYLEELEDSLGEEIEFDVIALCCEFSEIELETDEDIVYFREYFDVPDEIEDDDLIPYVSNEILDNSNFIGQTENSVIIQSL